MLKYFFGWVLTGLFLSLVHAQDPYYIKYDTKDGLPSSEVYDVEIDSFGQVWFTTDRGICAYNGYEFETYTTQDGLADNTNFDIYKDSKNRFWLNGYSGRVSVYENGTFRPYLHNDSLLTNIGGDWLGDMLETKDGRILTTSFISRGIRFIHLNENNYQEIINEKKIRDEFKVIDIPGNHFVVINEAALHFSQRKSSLSPSYNVQLAEFLNNSILFSIDSSLYKADMQGRVLQHSQLSNTIVKIYVDDQKNVWACTSNGLFYYEKGNLEQKPKRYFKGYLISNIIKDAEGSFWITTNQNGVLFVPSFSIDFFQPTDNKIAKERYLSIGKLKGHIFFGTSISNIFSIDKYLKIEKIFKGQNPLKQVRYINNNNEELFFSNKVRLKEVNGTIVFNKGAYPREGYSKQLMNNHVFNFGGRTFNINIGEKTIKSNEFERPFRGNLTGLIQSKNEDILIGTLKGLYKISNYNYEGIEQVLFDGRDTFGRISDLYSDGLDNKWVATIGNGLFYHAGDKVFQIKKENGLNSDLINHILMTDDSTVWIGTNKGLNVFNYRLKNDYLDFYNIKSLTTADGLSSNYINDVDYWQGKIWLATNNGISSFDPAIIRKKYPPVPVLISELLVNESSYTISDRLIFEHDKNDVFINFTGISFKRENEKFFYRYRLKTDSGNHQWFYTNEKNIRYNNMPSGEYTFEVAAQNKSGQWSEVPASVSFKIKAHYTETLWFKALGSILALSVIGFIGYFQIRRIRFREIEKRELQEAQLRIREAELAALRNQMNPHFVFNSLNSIQNFIFKKDIEKANYYLSKFSELMRNSLLYTRLDFITLKEEIDFLNNYLELESMRFGGKFDFNFKVDNTLDLDYMMIPSLLLQPVIENSIKHAFKYIEHKGKIEIEILQNREESLDIYIRDNGSGWAKNMNKDQGQEPKHKSLGLKIIRNRIKLLNEANHKIKASVSFKNLPDSEGKANGFQVYFVLPITYKK